MVNKLKYLFLFFGMWLSLMTYAQRNDTNLGMSFSGDLEKSLNHRWDLSIGEEVRLLNNSTVFNRSTTSIGLDYTIFDRRVKIGAYYAFIYLHNDDYLYEIRHRYYFNLLYKETLGRYTLSWRGRFQGTQRDENRGMYKVNPKYVMKNKFQVEYSVWGRPWKPFISGDLSTELNNPMGNELTRIRYEAGTAWRLNRTDYLEFFVRFDQYTDSQEPYVLALGIGYKLKL